MPFAQLIIGPPGAGKSTYCDGMHQFMGAVGRPCSVVNLDPANDKTNYPVAVDVRSLITIDEIMKNEELGPNGGVLYALEELEHNFEWLEEQLKELGDDYILFDCPGQVELFTHHASLRNIFMKLQKLGYRLVVIHLTDSYVLTQSTLYIAALLLALRAMLQMDLPHINVLTKIDNLVNHPPLLFNLDFYTEVQDLSYLLPHLDRERQGLSPPDPDADDSPSSPSSDTHPAPSSKFSALNTAIVDLVEDFALVGFETLAVEDKTSMANLLKSIDRASGYVFGGEGGANATIWQVAVREGVTMDVRDVQERWVDNREVWDRIRREGWEEEGKAFRGEGADGGVSVGGLAAAAERTEQMNGGGEDEEDTALDDLMKLRGISNMSSGGVKVKKSSSISGAQDSM